jgi:hypothetical protein
VQEVFRQPFPVQNNEARKYVERWYRGILFFQKAGSMSSTSGGFVKMLSQSIHVKECKAAGKTVIAKPPTLRNMRVVKAAPGMRSSPSEPVLPVCSVVLIKKTNLFFST